MPEQTEFAVFERKFLSSFQKTALKTGQNRLNIKDAYNGGW